MSESEERRSWDRVRIEMCRALARRSTCWKVQTAAIITLDNRFISEGFNGTTRRPHCIHVGPRDRVQHRSWSALYETHGEVAAIEKAHARGKQLRGATLYTLFSPCKGCAKEILNAGVARVVYGEVYKSREGVELLEAHGVVTQHI